MFMPSTARLDEIISELDPQDLPARYIVMAQITDLAGEETLINGQMLQDLVERSFDQISEIRIIVDVPEMRRAIIHNLIDIQTGVAELNS